MSSSDSQLNPSFFLNLSYPLDLENLDWLLILVDEVERCKSRSVEFGRVIELPLFFLDDFG